MAMFSLKSFDKEKTIIYKITLVQRTLIVRTLIVSVYVAHIKDYQNTVRRFLEEG